MISLALGLLLATAPVDPALVPGAPRLLSGHTGSIVTVAFAPDGKRVASAGFDKVVRVWDVAAGKQVLELSGPKDNIDTVAFSPDGKWLACGDAALALTLWSLPEGKPVRVMHNAEPIAHVVFSPDGKLLAAGGITGTGEVFAVADGKELYEIRTRTPAFSKDSKVLIGTTQAGALVLYDTATGKVKKETKGKAPSSSLPTPDLKQVFVWSGADRFVGVLDGATAAVLPPLNDAEKGISSVAISADGALLAVASEDREVRIYDPAKRAVVQKIPLEKTGFVAISPDKATLAVGDGAMVKLFAIKPAP